MNRKVYEHLARVWTLLLIAAVLGAPVQADDDISVSPDVVYGHKVGMALTMDVFRPHQANGAGILFMVSGGWYSKWTPTEKMRPIFRPLLDKGFTVFAVRHGSSPRYKLPDARADVDRAVRYIRLNAATFNIDPNRLGVYGGSAGGHLSLMIGLDSSEGDPKARDEVERTSSRVAAVVAYFPPVDLRLSVGGPFVKRFPALDFDKELAESVSPILYVTDDDPPILLIHGDADDLVPLSASESIHSLLQEVDVTTKLVVIEGGDHGFRNPEHRAQANVQLVDWFEKYLLTE